MQYINEFSTEGVVKHIPVWIRLNRLCHRPVQIRALSILPSFHRTIAPSSLFLLVTSG